MDIFVWGVGVGLTHTKNLIIKKLKSVKETGELEIEGENAKNPLFKQCRRNGQRFYTHGTYMRYSDNRVCKLQNSTNGRL